MAKNILTKRNFLAGLETNQAAVSNNDIPNLQQVESIVDGRQNLKDSVKVISIAGNITLSNTQTIDGVAVVAGDRVLVAAQTDATENGIYDVVDGGAWVRSADANTDDELKAYTQVFVRQGTEHTSHKYALQSETAVVIGTTEQTWVHTSSIDGDASHISVDSANIDWTGTNVQEVLESAEDAVEANTASIQANDTDIAALNTRVTTAEGEIDTLQTELDTAEATIVTNTGNITTNATDVDDLEAFTGSGGASTTDMATANYLTDASNLQANLIELDAEVYANRRYEVSAQLVEDGIDKVITHNLNETRLSSIMVYDNTTGQVLTDALDIFIVDANSFKLVQNSGSDITVDVSCRV